MNIKVYEFLQLNSYCVGKKKIYFWAVIFCSTFHDNHVKFMMRTAEVNNKNKWQIDANLGYIVRKLFVKVHIKMHNVRGSCDKKKVKCCKLVKIPYDTIYSGNFPSSLFIATGLRKNFQKNMTAPPSHSKI